MIVGIDASRANRKEKTGVEWYGFHLIEEMKKFQISNFPPEADPDHRRGKFQNVGDTRFILYSREPLRGLLDELPDNWESRVLRWPLGRLWTQIRLSWEMIARPPDILFIPSHVAPLIHPKKTVVTIHDVAAVRLPKAYSRFQRWYTLWSARYALKNVWKVIVPSQFVKDELIKTFPPKADPPATRPAEKHENFKTNKILVVSHGYDKRYRKIDNDVEIEKVLDKYNIRKPFLLSVGRWETKKNTERIIEAFNQISHPPSAIRHQLVLIGKPGYGFEHIQWAYEQSPYKDRIIMPGYVDPEDLIYIMNAAEVFVFPSLSEGFGLPVLEALACGRPTVAGKASSLPEVGGDAVLYVDPLDTDDIARGIKELLQNEAVRNKKIQLGLERVRQFSWERCAQETLKILIGEETLR